MIDWIRTAVNRLIPSGNVVERTVKSGVWMAATKIASRLLHIITLIVLARVLSPRAFGLVGIALLTLSLMQWFTHIGLNSALVQQKKENVDEYLNTVWCLRLGRGVVIFALIFFSAPLIARLFGEPGTDSLIRVIGLVPLANGLRNPGIVYFNKNLDFHKHFLYETSGRIVYLVVGVSYALVHQSVWALAFAPLANNVSKAALSYLLHDYRPRFSFDRSQAMELIDYGKWMTGASILGFVNKRGDDYFVGWFLSATALGFYQYAYQLGDAPASEVSGIVTRIIFPAFSKLQDDVDGLRQALLQSTRFTAFLAFPMATGIVLVAPSFVRVFLGSDWIPMVPALQLLAVYGLLHSITQNFDALWKAVGRPDYVAKLRLIQVVCGAIFIWPATARWGIAGTALVVVVTTQLPLVPVHVYLAGTIVETRSLQIYREYAYPLAASGTMFGTLWFLRAFVDLSPIVELSYLVLFGVALYTISALVLEHRFRWGMGRNLRTIVDGIRG